MKKNFIISDREEVMFLLRKVHFC